MGRNLLDALRMDLFAEKELFIKIMNLMYMDFGKIIFLYKVFDCGVVFLSLYIYI